MSAREDLLRAAAFLVGTSDADTAIDTPETERIAGVLRALADEQRTLRDYFAAHALAGLLPTVETYSRELQKRGSETDLDVFMAAMAYRYADAMIQARQS